MKKNICVNLDSFKNYDYIINYGYYQNDYLVKRNIEMYQDYVFNHSYLSSEQMNKLIDEIMYNYINDSKFQIFVEINLKNDNEEYFEDFKNVFINLYAIYKKVEKISVKRECRWL